MRIMSNEDRSRQQTLMKKTDFLFPLKGAGKAEKRHVVYDMETTKWEFPFLIGFYDGKEYHAFRNDPGLAMYRFYRKGGCVDKFMRWLFGIGHKCVACGLKIPKNSRKVKHTCKSFAKRYSAGNVNIFAHNGGRFDHQFLLSWLNYNQKLGLTYDFIMAGGRISMFSVTYEGATFQFRDSVSIIPMTLKEAAKVFCPDDLQKMPTEEEDYDRDVEDPWWDKYCEIDNRALYNCITQFTKLVHRLGGRVKVTAPGIAIDIFRRKYLKKRVSRHQHFPFDCPEKCTSVGICRYPGCTGKECHGCAHQYVRDAYYGGRTEVICKTGKNATYFDLNSSYPASMFYGRMPVGGAFYYRKPKQSVQQDVKRFDMWSKKQVGFVRATVEIPPTCHLPPLPYRLNGKLVFPTGKFTGTWDWEELKLLRLPNVKGKILKIHSAWWIGSEPLFVDFVKDLYHFRTKHICGDKPCGKKEPCNPDYHDALSFTAKLILNSGYGRFGMDPVRESIKIIKPGDEWPKNGYPVSHDLNEWRVTNVVNADYVIPQIAAHVTSLSRIALYKGMLAIEDQKREVFYVDTDSILSNGRLPESSVLGGWKDEEPGKALSGDFIAPKTYRLVEHDSECFDPYSCMCKTKHRMKGIPRAMQSAETWHKLVMEKGEIAFEQMTQVRSTLRHPEKRPIRKKFTKRLHVRPEDAKRFFFKDGRSRPLHVVEILVNEKIEVEVK